VKLGLVPSLSANSSQYLQCSEKIIDTTMA
jgi:hypothetical protein